MYFYCKILCILIVVYVFLLFVRVFLDAATLTEVFPCFFLSCEANASVQLAKTGHGPYSSNCCVVLCIVFLSFCVLFVCKCVLYYCHRVSTQLQLTNILMPPLPIQLPEDAVCVSISNYSPPEVIHFTVTKVPFQRLWRNKQMSFSQHPNDARCGQKRWGKRGITIVQTVRWKKLLHTSQT